MSTARKYTAIQRSMSPESRRSAYAAININWLQMRPDLRFESKEFIRDERLAWMTNFLQLRSPLASTVELSDKQLGLILEERRRMTGTRPKAEQPAARPSDTNVVQLADYKKPATDESTGADIAHLAGEAQIYTINKIVGFIGWSEEGFRDFLFKKFRRRSPRMLNFKDANSLTMILLTIAADKELRAHGKRKITRQMTAEYIPVLKRKLEIDR